MMPKVKANAKKSSAKSKKAELFLSSKFFLYAKGQKNEKNKNKIQKSPKFCHHFWLTI